MKPVLQENKISNKLWIMYIIIFIICTIGIGISLYLQFYQDENLGVIIGITDDDSEEQDEYNELKSEFSSLFTNQLENLQGEDVNIEKIQDDYDIIVTAYTYEKNEDNCSLDVAIPYINIDNEITKGYNSETRSKFKDTAGAYSEGGNSESIIYNVRYKAYLQNNILSLVIESELKEGDKSQKIEIKTYNYDIVEQKEVTLEDLLELKGVTVSEASSKIREEIEEVQEQNNVYAEQGYNLYTRDIESEIYEIENTENFFLGNDGMLYVVYAYGNTDYTSEMDIIIFY